MNERIQKLAEQATEIVETTDHCSGKSESTAQVNLEKFAELIVRECANICNKIYFDRYPDAEEWERSEEGDAIKKHFGVEE